MTHTTDRPGGMAPTPSPATHIHHVGIPDGDVAEILGALTDRVEDMLKNADTARAAKVEPSEAYFRDRAQTVADVIARLTCQLWGPDISWLSAATRAKLEVSA